MTLKLWVENRASADFRVTVGTIIGLLASGRTMDEILAAYPYLEAADLRAALAYAALRTEELELPLR